MSTFKVGDIVRVKSGSPVMTIVSCNPGNYYNCTWFSTDGKQQCNDFPGDALEISEKPKLRIG